MATTKTTATSSNLTTKSNSLPVLHYVEVEPEYTPSGERKCRMKWGDYDQMLDNEPEEYRNDPDIDYDVRITYGVDENGVRRTKRTQLVRIRTVRTTMPRAVFERRQRMKPFGAAKQCSPEKNKALTMLADPISIVPTSSKVDEDEEKIPEAPIIPSRTNNHIQCRNCGERGHWTRDCHKPRTIQNHADPSDTGTRTGSSGGSGYVPPSRRRNENGTTRYSAQEDASKIRLSNLPEWADEDDIRTLVQGIGRAHKVHLVRDRNTHESRGFAFINFDLAQTADQAVKKLNGYGYGHMILHAEKAKARAQ